MAKEDEVLEGLDNEEDLLDFDLDDISPEDLDEEDSEEEIIDLVEEVKEDQGPGDDEIANLLEEDQSREAEEDINFSTDEISGIPDILEDDESGEGEAGASVASLSLSDLDLDEPSEEPADDVDVAADVSDEAQEAAGFEELDIGLDDDEAVDGERPEADIPEIDLSGVFDEEQEEEPVPDQEGAAEADDDIEEMLGETIEAAVAEEVIPGGEMADAVVLEEELAPVETIDEVVSLDSQTDGPVVVSPERIEAIVKEVVQEVVERVARETMAEVAEKVITQAIDALKQNLDSSSE